MKQLGLIGSVSDPGDTHKGVEPEAGGEFLEGAGI